MNDVKKILLQVKAVLEKKLPKDVVLPTPIKGFNYDTEKPITIPKGKYDALGPERGRFVITDRTTGEFYLIDKATSDKYFK